MYIGCENVCGTHVIEYMGHSDILSEIEVATHLCVDNILDSLVCMMVREYVCGVHVIEHIEHILIPYGKSRRRCNCV